MNRLEVKWYHIWIVLEWSDITYESFWNEVISYESSCNEVNPLGVKWYHIWIFLEWSDITWMVLEWSDITWMVLEWSDITYESSWNEVISHMNRLGIKWYHIWTDWHCHRVNWRTLSPSGLTSSLSEATSHLIRLTSPWISKVNSRTSLWNEAI